MVSADSYIAMRVENIKKVVARGDLEQAQEQLDTLLALGPSNVEALKLKASLLRAQGRFEAEREIWVRIHELDVEDLDALRFLQKKQLEEREFFYFTDELPGGRRYLAYPKKMAMASLLGLLGCVLFFLVSHMVRMHALLGGREIILVTFALCVLLPWVLIIHRFLTGLVSIVVTVTDIRIKSRLRTLTYRWEELRQVCLAHQRDTQRERLVLVIAPYDATLPAVKIDVSDGSSSLCARSHLIAEVRRFCRKLEHTPSEQLRLNNRKWLVF